MVLCLLAKKPEKRKLVLCTLLSVLLVLGTEKLLYPLFGVAEAPSSELVAFPIQSVSYITRRQIDYIPEELRQRIDAVLGIDNILQFYNPNYADNMKACFNGDVKEILTLWFMLAKRFPGEFVYSVITASWKYFSVLSTGSTEFWYGIDHIAELGKHVEFAFTPVTADSYKLQVSASADFSSVLFSATSFSRSGGNLVASCPVGQLGKGTFYWRVQTVQVL